MSDPQVISGKRSRTIAEVKERAARIGAGLGKLGVGPGDHYAFVLRNEIAFLEANMAASAIGAVPIPVNWHWTGEDLQHVLTDSGAKVVIAHTDLLPAVEKFLPEGATIVEVETPPEIREAYGLGDVPLTGRYRTLDELATSELVTPPTDDPPMSVIYSSGTTGLAKGIRRNPVAEGKSEEIAGVVVDLMKLKPGGKTLVPAPMYHSSPNVLALFAVAMGIETVIMPKFDPEEFLALIEKHRIDEVQVVPTMFIRLLKLPKEVREKYDVSSLEAVIHAAAPCPADVKEQMIKWFGPIIWEYYGGTETGAVVLCSSEEALAHPGTVGRAFAGAQLRILGADNQPVPVGESGMVYMKPFDAWPDFTYLNDDEKRRSIEQDGFVTVGDIGYLDEDGFLYLSDRANYMVISGGVNIYPAEIEGSLLGMDGVADVAVFGIPDPDLGEVLAAHVELEDGATVSEEDIKSYVTTNLAKYKTPRVVVFEERLPREDSGKMFKRRLRDQYWTGNRKI
ncbi:long-chain acyl-CoA synthetase [Antricoccus suffuscus]|uniref:Long-chain acyl-CoA synthetase n=1 Tax=Antricoccus suffuscus TaxID=1629062 RepID=A0A2T1A3X9_9ACTN|nr:AMP-binding protein [Antricoccus suffuscus]PRZ43320.1 long-chain acyl-CoA synthetase [Antricoccus suffuscus]